MSAARALFLDRDGVINVDKGYVADPADCVFVEGIFPLCRAARHHGYLIVVVTNQAGIGRGYYTEEKFLAFSAWMRRRFAEEHADLDAIYYCPYHPEFGIGRYRRESVFRKPGPGMILQARDELDLDLGPSILIGDKPTDIAAGLAAGVGMNLLLCAAAAPDVSGAAATTAVVRNLQEAQHCLQGR